MYKDVPKDRRPRLRPKSAFSCMPPVHGADLKGPLRVDLTRSPHRLAMTAICAKPTAGGDVDSGHIGRRDLDLSDAAGLSWRVGGYRCSLDAWVRSQPYADFFPAASRAL
jgi:hypothetical protein